MYKNNITCLLLSLKTSELLRQWLYVFRVYVTCAMICLYHYYFFSLCVFQFIFYVLYFEYAINIYITVEEATRIYVRRQCIYHENPMVIVNSSLPGESGRHLGDDGFKCKCILVNEMFGIFKNSQKFIPKGPIHNNSSFISLMARCQKATFF